MTEHVNKSHEIANKNARKAFYMLIHSSPRHLTLECPNTNTPYSHDGIDIPSSDSIPWDWLSLFEVKCALLSLFGKSPPTVCTCIDGPHMCNMYVLRNGACVSSDI